MGPQKIILLLSTMVIGMLVSCSDDDKNEDCISTQTAFVTSVDAPETGTVNKALNVEVSFQVYNGCGGSQYEPLIMNSSPMKQETTS